MNIWQGLLFLSGDLGSEAVKTFAAEELELERARRELAESWARTREARSGALDAARRRGQMSTRELRRCA